MRLIAAFALSFLLLHDAGTAVAGGPACGCESRWGHEPGCEAARPHRGGNRALIQINTGLGHHGRCCHGCCSKDRDSRSMESPLARSAPAAPSGPVVESYPMMRAAPMMMAMPMMMGNQVRGVSFDARSEKDCCTELDERMDDLDKRVNALDTRMQTIQRAVEIQTRILEELKAQGTIGNKPIQAAPAKDGQ